MAPPELWQFATGAIDRDGNPSVSQFTRRQARSVGYSGIKDFQFVS